ncbi:hypothetical protein [Paramaledivibacter caminithermalis]|jgi:hypothetical protein|nr:hypothetical protein [Paramaledivibacter caminithermalis]
MENDCIKEQLKIQYFERIIIYSYYHKGQLINLSSPCELIMLNISFEGLEVITDKEFDKEDILLMNLRFDGIPFDKILGKIRNIKKIGEMYKICLDFIGIPNFLFERLKVQEKTL